MCDVEEIQVDRRYPGWQPVLLHIVKIIANECHQVVNGINVFARHPVVVVQTGLDEFSAGEQGWEGDHVLWFAEIQDGIKQNEVGHADRMPNEGFYTLDYSPAPAE